MANSRRHLWLSTIHPRHTHINSSTCKLHRVTSQTTHRRSSTGRLARLKSKIAVETTDIARAPVVSLSTLRALIKVNKTQRHTRVPQPALLRKRGRGGGGGRNREGHVVKMIKIKMTTRTLGWPPLLLLPLESQTEEETSSAAARVASSLPRQYREMRAPIWKQATVAGGNTVREW